MQPYYEAKSLNRWELAGKQVPPLVTQIADGENGGVMMNEFPAKYAEVVNECNGSETVLMNVTEYLEHLFALGIKESDFPVVQPIFQKQFGIGSLLVPARTNLLKLLRLSRRKIIVFTWMAEAGPTIFRG